MAGALITRRHLLAAASAASFASPARASGATLRLLTNWFAQAEHGGFYQAKATGLYEQAGVAVDIDMGGPQVNTMQLLLAGRCELVLGQPDQVLKGIANGLPLVAIATTFQNGIGGLLAHPDIRTIADLKGHPILISTETRTTSWPWLMRTYGFTEDQAGVYTFNIQPFVLNPQLAIQAFATSEPYSCIERGVPYRFLSLADAGYPGYGNMLVTTRSVLAQRHAELAGFLSASMQGWRSVLYGDPAPATAAIMAANPAMSAAQITWSYAALKRMQALGKPGTLMGRLDATRWAQIRGIDVASGLLDTSLDWHQAFTTEFDSAMTVAA